MNKISRALHFTNLSMRIRLNSLIERQQTSSNKAVLLNTSINSDNAGDAIIMYFAKQQLQSIFHKSSFIEYPTHCKWVDFSETDRDDLKIVCGTNALSTKMEFDCPIAFPKDVDYYRKTLLLMAVGLRKNHGRKDFSVYSKRLLNFALTDDFKHSVRDSNSLLRLRDIGITNVVNTSCVTMWNLTEEKCEMIPTTKADSVLTTVTDYDKNPFADGYMIETLLKNYKKIFVWLQGIGDYDYLKQITDVSKLYLIDGSFSSLKKFVEHRSEPIDYLGTRLHCGIFCLNNNIRSTVVCIDNRALDIHNDTGLPIIMRENIYSDMEDCIRHPLKTNIQLPWESIYAWKKQF